MFKSKTILVAPLDWGLGHATRCVPLVRQLMVDNVVILAITKTTSPIFEEEFPQLKKIEIEPYGISYSKFLPLFIKLLFDFPRIVKVIQKENRQLKEFIGAYNIDVVISDNRLGLYNSNIECVYITHQLNLQAGWLSFFVNKIHHHYIKKFNNIWVPDFKQDEQSLAGNLSRNRTFKNVTYIGPQSRLKQQDSTVEVYDYLFLLSGPEPQRTILENLIFKIACSSPKQICIIRGTPAVFKINKIPPHIKMINMATAEELSCFISCSNTVVCRSGYSTLMDLYFLRKQSIIFIPTPGQTEQIYLANFWKEKYQAKVMEQRAIKMLKLD